MSITKRAALAGLMALGLATPALAQAYPTKPITLIVPYAAGGPSDVIARLLGEQMSKTLGQPILIENVAGAGGTAGAKRLAASEPDGHTLLIHHLALAAAPALYGNLGYNTQDGFRPDRADQYRPDGDRRQACPAAAVMPRRSSPTSRKTPRS